MSRSLGDWHLPCLVRKPEVTFLDLKAENPLAIILMSDGVYEGIQTDAHIGEIIHPGFDPSRPDCLAHAIVQHAYALGSEDNLSAVVIPWEPRILD